MTKDKKKVIQAYYEVDKHNDFPSGFYHLDHSTLDHLFDLFIARNPTFTRDQCYLSFKEEFYYDDNEFRIFVNGIRLETDEEYEARLEKNRKTQEKRKANKHLAEKRKRDRLASELAELKKKYGDEAFKEVMEKTENLSLDIINKSVKL